MIRSFSLFLAVRYLKPKGSFISVISIITLLGVTLGIATLVVVIAVMTGFHEEMKRKILGHDPHLIVAEEGRPMSDWEPLMEELGKEPGIDAVAPFVLGGVMLRSADQYINATMRGIDPDEEEKLLPDIRKFVVEGKYDLDGDKCILGKELAKKLEVGIGDFVTVYGPGHFKEAVRVMEDMRDQNSQDPNAPKPKKPREDIHSFVRPLELEVAGLFESGHYSFDQEVLLTPLNISQIVYGFEGDIHGIAVRTKDAYWADAVLKPHLEAKLGSHYSATSWIDMNRKLFESLEMERTLLFFIVAITGLVASFSIANTLITITVQKRREIGVIKALGAAPGAIVRVFMAQGVVVGIFGNITGFTLAGLILYFRDQIQALLGMLLGVKIFQKEIYQFNRIPAEIVPSDMLLIGGLSFVICVLAAVVPAWAAARLDPVKALRED